MAVVPVKRFIASPPTGQQRTAYWQFQQLQDILGQMQDTIEALEARIDELENNAP